MEDAWRERANGLDLAVRVTPRGGKDAIEGLVTLADGRVALKIRVRVAPEDGAANRAVEKLLAKALGVPASAVSVRVGETARMKTVAIAGDAAFLSRRLRELAKVE